MRHRDMHLYFFRQGERLDSPDAFYVEWPGKIAPLAVECSGRLRAALGEYVWQLDHLTNDSVNHGILDLLTAWIGRLVWDDFFATPSGEPNAVGRALLDAVAISQADGTALRVLLHGKPLADDPDLARIPWTGLLFLDVLEDNKYRAFSTLPDPPIQIIHCWPGRGSVPALDSKQPMPGAAPPVHQRLRVLVTRSPGSDVGRLTRNFVGWLKERDSEFQLVGADWDALESPGKEAIADIWIHFAHGINNDKVRLLASNDGSGRLRSVGTHEWQRIAQHIKAPVVMLNACETGVPVSKISDSVVRILLGQAGHVISFIAPVLAGLAREFNQTVLEQLRLGCDLESAVSRSRSGLDWPNARSEIDLPLRWWQAVPTVHTTGVAPPQFEGGSSPAFEHLRQRLQDRAEILRESHRQREDIPLMTEGFIKPRVELGPFAVDATLNKLGLAGNAASPASRPVLLHGGAGMGKSTFLHYLGQEMGLLPEWKGTILLLPCAELGKQRRGLRENREKYNLGVPEIYAALAMAVLESTTEDKIREFAGFIEAEFAKGRLLLLIDALDEALQPNDPGVLREWSDFLRPLFHERSGRCVITCRKELAKWQELTSYFPHADKPLELRLWDESEIKEFLEQRSPSADKVRELRAFCGEILSTPLFARLCADALAQSVSDGRIQFAALLQTTAQKWAQREGPKAGIEPSTLLKTARHCAHYATRSGLVRIPLPNLLDDINKSLKRNDQLPPDALRALAIHSLLMIEGETAQFGYDIFKDYFEADHLRLLLLEGAPECCGSLQADFRRSAPSARSIKLLAELLAGEARQISRELKVNSSRLDDSTLRDLFFKFILPLCSRLDQIEEPVAPSIVFKRLRFSGPFDNLVLSGFQFEDCRWEIAQFNQCTFSLGGVAGGTLSRCTFHNCTFRDFRVGADLDRCQFSENSFDDESKFDGKLDEESDRELQTDRSASRGASGS